VSSTIHPTANVGRNTAVGENTIISEQVTVGEGCLIGHGVVIHPNVSIGSNVRIDDHAVIGKQPMRAANSILKKQDRLEPAEIGDDCIIGTAAIIYTGCRIGQKVLVADEASVRENTTVGDYTIVGRGVTVENFCTVGRYCKLETESYITAYSTIEDRVFIAPQVTTSNDNYGGRTEERFKHFKGVTVKKGGRIGVGSVILPGKIIGEDALVAGGSVVTADVPPRKIVRGVPARVWRDVPEEQLLENQNW
jgi:UDP-2-acetamido-3-amino-2,3-dideoxy-glucuronate N-acetyltransferase